MTKTDMRKTGGLAVTVSETVYHWVMVSLAFWLAMIVFGGPLALVAAQAAVLFEMRTARQTGNPRRGAFMRVLRGARANWRPALTASMALIGGLGVLAVLSAARLGPVVEVVVLSWLAILAGHWSFALSLERPPLSGPPVLFAYAAWLHLVGILVWVGGFLTLVPGLPLVLFGLPALYGFVVVKLETQVVAAFKRMVQPGAND